MIPQIYLFENIVIFIKIWLKFDNQRIYCLFLYSGVASNYLITLGILFKTIKLGEVQNVNKNLLISHKM